MERVLDRTRVLDTARRLWEQPHELDLDTVDGTFYWGVCRWSEIEEIRNSWDPESGMSPSYVHKRLLSLIPASDNLGFDWSRIPMRSAATRCVISFDYGRTAAGGAHSPSEDFPDGEQIDYIEVLEVDVRNQEWRGVDVEAAAYRSWESQSISRRGCVTSLSERISKSRDALGFERLFINCKLFREGEYTTVSWWNEGSPDAKPERFTFEPFVRVWVSTPPPAPGVLALHYDSLVREQRKWHLELRGGVNGQDVATAIRAWAVGLLEASGVNHWRAMADVSAATDGAGATQQKHRRDLARILARVPEARTFLK